VACPFIAIYVATILTETLATFFMTASVLAASVALRANGDRKSPFWWAASGLFGGLATMVRPDAGLSAGGLGLTMIFVLWCEALGGKGAGSRLAAKPADHTRRAQLKLIALNSLLLAAGFCVALSPWTVRNARVFGVFQPIAPTRAGMPG